ncbi:MAG: cation:dicarboxylate symporter family transporter, partial [Flavisolibacter sp.]
FSTSQIEQNNSFNFLNFYIPSNIFNSLSNNVVPAVVVFSVALGIAMIGVKGKESFLNILIPVSQALGRVTNFLVGLAPFGVFAIIASALGVMRLDELARLQVYMINYMVISLLLTFWILPAMVACITPFKYKDIVKPVRTALVTAFATGNIFVVLPLLSETSKKLMQSRAQTDKQAETTVDVIIPASFSFPNMGKILTISFVLFAGWSSNASIPVTQYPVFTVMGFFSFFGDPTVAIPTLLNIFHIPSDTFRFFPIADSLIGTRFGTLLAAMYTLVLAILSASAVSGILKINWKKLLPFIGITLALILISISLLQLYYHKVVRHEYKDYEALVSLDMNRQYAGNTITVSQSELLLASLSDSSRKQPSGISRIDDIKNRGSIRVGYFSDALPFAFENKAGKLVGFDIEMAYILAQDMKVKLELVKTERNKAAELLNNGTIDIVMSGIAVTLDKTAEMGMTNSYINQTFAFIVKDYRLNDFNSSSKLKSLDKVKIGVPDVPYYIEKLKQYAPQAEISVIGSPKDFFDRKEQDLDAYEYSAEAGSAWSLIHPEYTVAIPYPDVLEVPLAFGIKKGDFGFKNYLDTWIELKKKDKTIDTLYDHWILGKNTKNKEPTWSIMRNVLHWTR